MKHLRRKPDWYLSKQLLHSVQGVRRACTVSCDCQNPTLVLNFTPAPAEHLYPHFPSWLPWRERFPRRPWLSKVFEDNKLLKSNIPSPTFTYSRHADVPHRSWTRGTACLLHCYLHRMWSSQESEALLAGIKATSFWGTCMHITTRRKT